MLLNLSILKDRLQALHILQAQTDPMQKRTLKFPRHYQGETTFDPSVLYVAVSENLPLNPDLPEHLCLICLGFPPAAYVSAKECEFVCIRTDNDITQVFQLVLEIFYEFESLNETFKDMIIARQSYETFGKLCYRIFQTPVSAFGTFEKVLFIEYDKEKENDAIRYAGCLGDYLDNEERCILYADKDWVNTLSVHGPAFMHSTMYSTNILYYNLFRQDHYIGRIMIEDSCREFQDGDYMLLEWIGDYLRMLLEQNQEFHFEASQGLENLIQRLLSDIKVQENQGEPALSAIGWEKSDEYICTAISQLPSASLDSTLNNAAFFLSDLLEDNYIFIQNHIIYQILNLTRSPLSLPEVQRRLRIFQNNNALQIGYSTIFCNFYELHNYLLQATLMVNYAVQTHSGRPLEYEKNILPMMLWRIRDHYDSSVFVSHRLRRLFDYDAQNHSELVMTLKSYLANHHSLSKTMEELYIARSSCSYRIRRIEEITGLSLEDPDVSLYLQLLLKLLG